MTTSVDPYYHRYIGKVLKDVENDLAIQSHKQGYSLSIMDSSFLRNIDVEPKRLNVLVDDDFHITMIWVG